MAPEGTTDSALQRCSLKRKMSKDSESDYSEPLPTTRSSRKRLNLRVIIPRDTDTAAEKTSPDSLFSCSDLDVESAVDISPDSSTSQKRAPESDYFGELALVSRLAPPIPGLFFNPSFLLPKDIADAALNYCMKTYFSSRQVNQVMLFGRAPSPSSPVDSVTHGHSGIPPPLMSLLDTLSDTLGPFLPPDIHSLIFPRVPTRARQAIINLYHPGEGISAHVDLLGRFGDGILGVSLSSGCAMQFVHQKDSQSALQYGDLDAKGDGKQQVDPSVYDVYLPERSVLVMTGDARYKWSHGIARRTRDYVTVEGSNTGEGEWINRTMRLSITFRWLLPGAEIVGD